MQLERKLTTVALIAVAVAASVAFAQVSPGSRGTVNSGSQTPAASGIHDDLAMTPMQEVLQDLILWQQSNTLQKMGGHPTVDYSKMSDELFAARMEVIRAANLFQRATLNATQQAQFDKSILDPKGHPLPAKWENMRLKGTLVAALLKSDPRQQQQSSKVLNTFRDRNHAIWGTKAGINGGYAKNHSLMLAEFRTILNKAQLDEFNGLWTSYTKEVAAAQKSVTITP